MLLPSYLLNHYPLKRPTQFDNSCMLWFQHNNSKIQLQSLLAQKKEQMQVECITIVFFNLINKSIQQFTKHQDLIINKTFKSRIFKKK